MSKIKRGDYVIWLEEKVHYKIGDVCKVLDDNMSDKLFTLNKDGAAFYKHRFRSTKATTAEIVAAKLKGTLYE